MTRPVPPGAAGWAQDQDLSPDGRNLYVSRGHRGDVAAFDLATGGRSGRSPSRGCADVVVVIDAAAGAIGARRAEHRLAQPAQRAIRSAPSAAGPA